MSAKTKWSGLICRMPVDQRRDILAAIGTALEKSIHRTVQVEHNLHRTLEGAEALVGTIVGLAYINAPCPDVLVVQPRDRSYRMQAIPASQVLRIRLVDLNADGTIIPGKVIAGPPVKEA